MIVILEFRHNRHFLSSQYPNIGLSIFEGGIGSDLDIGLGSNSVSYSLESPGLGLGWVSGSGSGSISDSRSLPVYYSCPAEE